MITKYSKISSHELNYNNNKLCNVKKTSNNHHNSNSNNVTSTSSLLIIALIALIAFVMLIITLTSITDVFTDKTHQVPVPMSITSKATTANFATLASVSHADTPSLANSATNSATATPHGSSGNNYTNNKSFGNEVVSMTAKGDNFELFSADGHNGFYDKINTSNKRNEFNSLARRNLEKSVIAKSQQSSSAESFFENIELQESLLLSSPHQHKQLLPHRNKRYLLFPESSSFQMIFDLIIGIVDYSSFAILGITCAVAWELPSKPPSEILDDIKLRLNDGTLGISRRNDSTQQTLEFIDSPLNAVSDIQNTNKATVSATVDANVVRTSQMIDTTTFEQGVQRKPMATASGYNYNFYNHDYEQLSRKPSILRVDAVGTNTDLPNQRNAYRPVHNRYYADDKFGHYDGSEVGGSGIKSFHPSFAASLDNHNDVTGATGGDLSGVRNQHVDWKPSKSASYDNKYKYGQQQHPANSAIRNNYANNNWWQRNKQRVQSNWQQKQSEWNRRVLEQNSFNQFSSSPITTTTPTAAPPQPVPTTRTGRNRQILQATPKHRIYPVFGKRRRRSTNEDDDDVADSIDDFELKMDRVHRREHLRTRQKLFGKIEKLFNVNGHNGTECVMRALCETAARNQRDAPQSFISELLRAIFTMPHDLHQHHEEAYELSAHYREAHAVPTECASRYALCVHSIWSDLKYGMKL